MVLFVDQGLPNAGGGESKIAVGALDTVDESEGVRRDVLMPAYDRLLCAMVVVPSDAVQSDGY